MKCLIVIQFVLENYLDCGAVAFYSRITCSVISISL